MKIYVKHRPHQHWKHNGSHVRRLRHAALFRRVLRAMHSPQSPPAASPAQPHCASRSIYSGFATQCRFRRCINPTPAHRVSFLGASTLMTRWIDSIASLRVGTLVAPHFTIPSTWMPLSVSAVPVVMTFALPSHARRSTEQHRRHQVSRFSLPCVLPMVSLSKQPPCDPRSQLAPAFTSSGASLAPTSAPSLQPHVSTTQVGTHTARSSPAHKRSASNAQAGTHSGIGAGSRAGRGPFPKPRPVVLPMVSFGQAKPAGLGHIHNADSDLMHHQFRLSILHWNPGPTRRNPTQIIAATCGRFHAVIL